MQRKLTVIFSADVVGYSGLMERDEAGTCVPALFESLPSLPLTAIRT